MIISLRNLRYIKGGCETKSMQSFITVKDNKPNVGEVIKDS